MLKISEFTFLVLIVAITSSLTACSPAPEESVKPTVKAPVQDPSEPEKNKDIQPSKPEEPYSVKTTEEGQSPTITEASTEVIKALEAEDLQTVSSWVSGSGYTFLSLCQHRSRTRPSVPSR